MVMMEVVHWLISTLFLIAMQCIFKKYSKQYLKCLKVMQNDKSRWQPIGMSVDLHLGNII